MARPRLILQLMAIIRPPAEPNSNIHEGNVLTVAPIDLSVGSTVITPDGFGEVKVIIPNWVSKKPEHIDVQLYRGFIKRYRVMFIQQYVVYHIPSGQFIKLSPANYRYIYKNKQPILYRVTNRKYAQMTEESKIEYGYVKTLNKQRGGIQLLRTLERNNLEIKRRK